MIRIPHDDETMRGVVGSEVPSEVAPDVTYKIEQILGKGGMSVAFLATRRDPDGDSRVVVKLLRPQMVRKLGASVSNLVRKEAVAMGRLNERTPPTPFVVRLVDTGEVDAVWGELKVKLPWIAIEYVHGGPLGTTLLQRVKQSLKQSHHAFDARRAAHAVECVAAGLSAVHEVGVIHRDLTPNNVLCTGAASDELFKIADFGVARPEGVDATIDGQVRGTPGFAAPELTVGDDGNIGPWTDVFSFGATIFYLLTGELLFASRGEVLRTLETPTRRSIMDSQGLAPELKANERLCKSIDLVIGWATAGKVDARLTEALAVSAMMLPHLQNVRPKPQPLRSYMPPRPEPATTEARWTWSILKRATRDFHVRSVAWDGYGRSLAATSEGLVFWDGRDWRRIAEGGIAARRGFRFVRRIGPGRWVLVGDDPLLLLYGQKGVEGEVEAPRGTQSMAAIAGDLDDVTVLVSTNEADVPCLTTYVTQRWLKSLPLPGVGSVATISRFDESRFLVAGRKAAGGAWAALYSALDWEIEELETPDGVPAYIASASNVRRESAVLVGPKGSVLTREGASTKHVSIVGEPFLSAVALDPFGRSWAATAGQLFVCGDEGWNLAWEDASVVSPVVSLLADAGLCIAVTADGMLIEGRGPRPVSDEISNSFPVPSRPFKID
jgi:serine/threonine protein kinase